MYYKVYVIRKIPYSTAEYAKQFKLYDLLNLKVPERYEKFLRVSSSVKGKPVPAPPNGREWATS
jgi:hypothetical protein